MELSGIAKHIQDILFQCGVPTTVRDDIDNEFNGEVKIIESRVTHDIILGKSEYATHYTAAYMKQYGGGQWEPPSEDYVEMAAREKEWDIVQFVVEYILDEHVYGQLYKHFPECNPER